MSDNPDNLDLPPEGNNLSTIDGEGVKDHEPESKTSWKDRVSSFAEKTGKAAKEAARIAAEKKRQYDEYSAKKKAGLEEQEAVKRARESAKVEEEHQRQAAEFEAQRRHDIARAMAMNVSSGGAGVPYMVIDVVHAFDTSGGTGLGHGARPGDAFAGVKQKLWDQCQYYDGDAVLFCHFGWDKGTAHFRNTGAALSNVLVSTLGAATRMGIQGTAAETRTETTITLWGYGTIVKFMPDARQATPDDYANFDAETIEMRPINLE